MKGRGGRGSVMGRRPQSSFPWAAGGRAGSASGRWELLCAAPAPQPPAGAQAQEQVAALAPCCEHMRKWTESQGLGEQL